MSILQYFPAGHEPWDGQRYALEEIERTWDSTDVYVIDSPVGSGKQFIATTVARWSTGSVSRGGAGAKDAWIGVPSNALLDQYEAGPVKLASLRGRDLYQCHRSPHLTCAEYRAKTDAHCKGITWHDPQSCPYVRSLRASHSAKVLVTNWHTALAHGVGREVVIVDEAHGVEDLISELEEVKIWRHQYGWRGDVRSTEEARWLLEDLGGAGSDHKLSLLSEVLNGQSAPYLFDPSPRLWHSQERECISLLPTSVAHSAGRYLWPRARKIVLLSATLSLGDVRRLGLMGRRVRVIRVPSPIPPERRPIAFHPVANLTKRGRDAGEIDKLVRFLVEELLPAHVGERGFVHATYEVAEALRRGTSGNSRLMFHGRDDRGSTLSKWLADGSSDSVLVGSGLHEGLDLKGPLARFQVLTTTPRPSLGTVKGAYLAEREPDTYEWLTIRELAQASGRVCRGPDDYGLTLITDSSARRELSSKQLPQHFREALTGI